MLPRGARGRATPGSTGCHTAPSVHDHLVDRKTRTVVHDESSGSGNRNSSKDAVAAVGPVGQGETPWTVDPG